MLESLNIATTLQCVWDYRFAVIGSPEAALDFRWLPLTLLVAAVLARTTSALYLVSPEESEWPENAPLWYVQRHALSSFAWLQAPDDCRLNFADRLLMPLYLDAGFGCGDTICPPLQCSLVCGNSR